MISESIFPITIHSIKTITARQTEYLLSFQLENRKQIGDGDVLNIGPKEQSRVYVTVTNQNPNLPIASLVRHGLTELSNQATALAEEI